PLFRSTEGKAITPAPSIRNQQDEVKTEAAGAVRSKEDFVGRYSNAADQAVIGSTTFIPLLGWGLVVEQDEAVALADVRKMLTTLVVLTLVILGVSVGVSVFRSE